MLTDPQQSESVAFSFAERRDDEIAQFFANGMRTFHPVMVVQSGDAFGQERIVGTVHSAHVSTKKPTAAFRSTLPLDAKKSLKVPLTAMTNTSNKTNDPGKNQRKTNIDGPLGKTPRPLGSIANFGLLSSRTKKEAAKVVFDPVQRTASSLDSPKTKGVEKCRVEKCDSADVESPLDSSLSQLIEKWGVLPNGIRESIVALANR